MWIKTQGGYLLNLDNVEYVRYDDVSDTTFAVSDFITHAICEGNCLDNLCNAINRRYDFMEVR